MIRIKYKKQLARLKFKIKSQLIQQQTYQINLLFD